MSEIDEIAHAIAGAGGGALSMMVTYPLVTLSTLAQTTQKKKAAEAAEAAEQGEKQLSHREEQLLKRIAVAIRKSATVEAAETIVNEKGFLGLYSGLESALYGITLTNFIYYYFYEFTSNVFLKSNALTARKGKGLLTLQLMATGAIAGAITCVGLNPFWVANTRTMTAKLGGKSASTFRTLINIIENDGVGTLFAGVLPALVLVANPIIQYTIFEQIKNVIIARDGRRSFTAVKAFFIGAFGKLIATALTYPYITLKSRMHVKKKAVKAATGAKEVELSMVQEIRKIVTEEGLEGLYRGLSVKLLQSITTAAFLFYFKEELLVGLVRLVEILKVFSLKRKGVAA